MPKKSKGPRMGSRRKPKDPANSDLSGYRQKIREKKRNEANKPKGCARLAVMILFLPIVAVAAFWFLMS